MRHALIALPVILAASAALAQTATSPPAPQGTSALRAMLAALPVAVLDGRAEIEFGDLAAARALDLTGVQGANPDPGVAQLRGLPASSLGMSLRDPATGWRDTVGFGPGDLQQVLVLSAPPAGAMILQLGRGSAAQIAPALRAQGYVQGSVEGVDAWERGEDFAFDLAARNPDDPFGAGMGRASRVQIDGDLIRQGTGWPLMTLLAGAAQAPATSDPGLRAILGVLDQLDEALQGAVLGAVLLTDMGMAGLADPAPILSPRTRTATSEVPAGWGMGLFADLGSGPESTGVLAVTVTLPDVSAAEALRSHVEAAWTERISPVAGQSFAELTGGIAQVTVHPVDPTLWVLRLAVSGPTEVMSVGLSRNRAHHLMVSGAMMGDLVFLQP